MEEFEPPERLCSRGEIAINSENKPYCIDQFSNKRWRSVVYIYYAEGVLGSQGRRSSHSIASMSPDHFLICLETPANQNMQVSSSDFEECI